MAAITLKFAFFDFVLFVVFVILMATVSGRLLGLRVGRWRSALAALLGIAAGTAGAEAIGHHNQASLQYLLAALFGVLATMTFLIVPEALGRAKGRAKPSRSARRFLHPLRWIRHLLAPISRWVEVLRYARRRRLTRPHLLSAEGVGTPEFAHRLRLTLEDAGGMFVKFGQIASTRGDLLAPPVIEELSFLRASVRPIPSEYLRPLVEAELGRPVESVFASFEWEPLAAASIGQTHRAVLKSGDAVVAKIQRPGLDDLLSRDAAVLRFAARVVERRSAGAALLGVRDLAEELIVGMERELDYVREAMMSDRLRTSLDGVESDRGAIRVPYVYHELSTNRLLVMEQASGQPIDRPGAIEASGIPPNYLAAALLRSFLTQILQGGVFHADPHPGNLMIDEWGRLWLLDFGAVGLLDPGSRRALQEIALGTSIGEPLVVARALRNLAGTESTVSLQSLESDIGILMVESDSGGFGPSIIQDILGIMARQGLRVPPSMSLLGRALLTLDGTLKTIEPTFDVRAEAEKAMKAAGPAPEQAREDLLKHELERALPALRTVPDHLDELATQLRAGRLSVRVQRFADTDRQVVGAWIDRILTGVIGGLGLIASAILLLAGEMSPSRDTRLTLRSIGFIGLVVASVLVMRSVARILRRDRTAPVVLRERHQDRLGEMFETD